MIGFAARLGKSGQALRLVFFVWGALALQISGSLAKELSPADAARLGTTIERFQHALETSDTAGILEILPPRLLEQLARRAEVTPDVLLDEVRRQMSEIVSKSSFETISFDPELISGVSDTDDGLLYGFVPLVFRMTVNVGGPDAETYTVDTEVFALLENSAWYLLRIQDPGHVHMLVDAYPSLAGVTFGKGRVRLEK